MKYCKKVIINHITNQLDEMESNKLMVRIESFGNAKLYWEIYRYFCAECQNRKIEFTAKITLKAWEKLKQNYPFETKQLENEDVVDSKNRITYYRNKVEDKKTLILFLGTEYAEDKAGLNELHFINPSIIEDEVGTEYSKLFEKYDWLMEKEKKRLDHYYHELFKHVGKNILHLSDLADRLPDHISGFEDLMECLFEGTYTNWKIPNLSGQDVNKVKEKGKIDFLEKASDFVERKNFDKVSVIKKVVKKIEDYRELPGIYVKEWPMGTAFASYDEFVTALTNYTYGQEIEKYRDQLCSMPFYIINSILELKRKDPVDPPKNQSIKLYDEPFLMLGKTVAHALAQYNQEKFDTFVIQVEKIGIAGVYGEEEQTDTEQKIKEIWKQVCCYAGGVLEFFNEKLAQCLGNRQMQFEDEDIFDGSNLEELWNKGIICALSNSNKLSSVKYKVILKNQGVPLKAAPIKCEWRFSEQDGWFNTFTEFVHTFFEMEEDAYLPFGIIKKIDRLVQSQEMEEFYHAFSYAEVEYKNILTVFKRKFGDRYPEWYEKYESLARAFMEYVGSIAHKGFYGTIHSYAMEKLQDTYEKLAKELFYVDADEQMFEMHRLFLNAFFISDSDDGIERDLEMNHAILPSYHPATVEKLREKMLYIASGMQEMFENFAEEEGSTAAKRLEEVIEALDERSTICSAVDVMKSKNRLIVADKMYFSYAVYSNYRFELQKYQSFDTVQNSIEYDEEYDASQFKTMTAEAKMMCRYISEYTNTFPMARETLDIAVVHYNDFQPVIAALHYITKQRTSQMKHLNLHIYMPKEKTGGQSYLLYWLDNFFDEDSKINIQIYLNYYDDENELTDLFQYKNIDILKNILVEDTVDFSSISLKCENKTVKFPMIYKPLPMSKTSMRREVEVSQLQFAAASAHTKLLYRYLKRNMPVNDIEPMVVRKVRMDEEKLYLVEELHKKAGWVVCMDMGIDKRILHNYGMEEKPLQYRMIGFSTGEGAFGEYNVTVSARNEMVMDLKDRTKQKLTRVFGRWNEEQLEQAAAYCVDRAKDLDGSSLLKALNPKDEDINNFLAYVLTNEYIKEQKEYSDYQILICLDSYKHWFRGVEEFGGSTLEKYPDFLYLTICKGDYGKEGEDIAINATLIECKLANESQGHLEKARVQINNGFKILQERFNPDSMKTDSRFWFLQLYRVLVFSQINVEDNKEEFNMLAKEIIGILDGRFNIQWSGEIYTFWRDLDQNTVEEVLLEELNGNSVKQVIFGQQKIKQMLTGKEEMLTDAFDIVLDEEELRCMEQENECREEYEEEYESQHWNEQKEGQENEHREEHESQHREKQENTTDNENRAYPEEKEKVYSGTKEEFGKEISIFSTRMQDWNTQGTSGQSMQTKSTLVQSMNAQSTNEQVEKQQQEEQVYDNQVEKTIAEYEAEKEDGADTSQNMNILIGETRQSGENIYWNYANKDMSNRHLLITGKSGQGKTYAIQGLLLECSRAGIPAVIFDYTEGFNTKNLNDTFKQELGDKIKQKPIKYTKMPINPFERHKVDIHEILDENVLSALSEAELKEHSLEDVVAVSTRIADILTHVYSFGPQQYAAIYAACKLGLEKNKENMNFQLFRQALEELNTKEANTVLTKITPFLDTDLFHTKATMDWGDLLHEKGVVNVIQLTQIPRDMQIVVTEFILWDLWYYSVLNEEEKNPFIVVLDEAQNLDFGEKSVANKILTEGRKFGWSGWFATQFLKGQLKEDEIGRLQQAPQRIYFRPPDNEIVSMAQSIDPDKAHTNEWVNRLKHLNKSECIVVGDSIFGNGGRKKYPVHVKVSAMKKEYSSYCTLY